MDGLNDDRMSERERRADKILMLRIDISTRILCAMISTYDRDALADSAIEAVEAADILINQCRYGEDGPPEEDEDEEDLDEPDDDEDDEEEEDNEEDNAL